MVVEGDGSGVCIRAEHLIAQRAFILKRERLDPAITTLPGGFVIRRRGNGQVIADSRAYADGDDIRHVDRGATARTGKLHIRTFHDERDKVTFLLADFRPSMLWGMRRAFRSVAAAENLARLGWQATEAGGRVGLMAITAEETVIVPIRGRVSGMLAVIGGLVRAHDIALDAAPGGLSDPPLSRALAGLSRIVPRGAAVVIASGLDSRGADFGAVAGACAQHRDLRFLIVEDSTLRDLPPGRYPITRPDGSRMGANFGGPRDAPPASGPDLGAFTTLRIDAGMPVSNDVLALAG